MFERTASGTAHDPKTNGEENIVQPLEKNLEGYPCAPGARRAGLAPRCVICHGVNSHGGQYRWAAEQGSVNSGLAVRTRSARAPQIEGERLCRDRGRNMRATVAAPDAGERRSCSATAPAASLPRSMCSNTSDSPRIPRACFALAAKGLSHPGCGAEAEERGLLARSEGRRRLERRPAHAERGAARDDRRCVGSRRRAPAGGIPTDQAAAARHARHHWQRLRDRRLGGQDSQAI